MQPAEFINRRFGCRRVACPEVNARLWLIDAAPDAAALSEAALVLSDEEIDRAGRFRRAEDRARFMLTRAALRHSLGDATGRQPQALAFALGPFGKPFLVGDEAPHFSVSHSGALALIGIAPRRPIGVDLELATADVDELDLAEAFFCEAEHRFLKGLEGAARRAAFYAIWTSKEAVLKAYGVGITSRLKDFCVHLKEDGVELQTRAHCFAPALATARAGLVQAPDGYAAAYALA